MAKENKEKVKFKDLSLLLKIGIAGGIFFSAEIAVAFIIGFVQGFLSI